MTEILDRKTQLEAEEKALEQLYASYSDEVRQFVENDAPGLTRLFGKPLEYFDPSDSKFGFDSKRQAYGNLLRWRIQTAQLRADNVKGIEQANAARKNAEEARKKIAEETRQRALKIAATPRKQTQEEYEAAQETERRRNSAPDRQVYCPACGGQVHLVGGKLPTQHTYVHVDPEKQWKEKRVCNPYGEKQA